MAHIDLVIGFDADDTLWHNETVFEEVHKRHRALLSRYHDGSTMDRTLFETETRNLELYGYGIKGFTLSAIETAIELTKGRISADEIRQIIELGRDMLAHPVELVDGAVAALSALAENHPLVLITKGDLRDQERKLMKSGLADRFRHVEIVSEKNEGTYSSIFRRHRIDPARFLMVGNSVKSDILPVLALGGAGAHVPYHITWAGEKTDTLPPDDGRFFQLKSLHELPEVVARLARDRASPT